MEYNAINRVLALFEAAVLDGSVDEFLNRESLIHAAKRIESASSNSEKNISQFADNIFQALKTDEFKEVVKTNEFQELYDITSSLPPILQGGLKEFFKRDHFNAIGKTKTWNKFAELEVVKQIERDHELLSIGSVLLSEKLRILSSPHDINISFPRKQDQPDRLNRFSSFVKGLFSLGSVVVNYKKSRHLIIQFRIFNKETALDLQRLSKEYVTRYLSKYLIEDNYKNKIISDTVQLCKELTTPQFLAQIEAGYMVYCLSSLHDFIHQKETVLFNFIFQNRKQNSWIYQTYLKEDISRYMAPEELFLFCINAGSNVSEMCNFYNNNYGAIWQNYINSIDAEKEPQPTKELAKRLREKLGLSLLTSANIDQVVDPIVPKAKKEKLPCDNYLYAALLYEKSQKTGVEFLPLCREAAKKYCSKKGKEFSGEQLSNVFHQKMKQFDNFPDFCKPEYNGNKMKKLKKELNWPNS